jgi:RNA polymerase-interacting CarD/CdnL/TRCF family regulator
MISLAEQLECARLVRDQMRSKQSKWLAAQEAIVATLERQLLLEEVSNALKGRPTQPVELV